MGPYAHYAPDAGRCNRRSCGLTEDASTQEPMAYAYQQQQQQLTPQQQQQYAVMQQSQQPGYNVPLQYAPQPAAPPYYSQQPQPAHAPGTVDASGRQLTKTEINSFGRAVRLASQLRRRVARPG